MYKSFLSILLVLTLFLTCIPASLAESDGLTLYLPCFTRGNTEEASCEYASRLLREAGIDVTFEVFSSPERNYADAYTAFMIDHSSDADAAFVAPISMLEPLCEEGWFCSVSPLSLTVQPVNRPAVLVRTDLLEFCNHSLRDADSLESWLYERFNETGKAPLAAAPLNYDRTYGGYTWLNLFLPGEGYYPLNNEFSFAASADFFASTDGDEFCTLSQLPVAKACADRWFQWVNDGLIQTYTLRSPAPGSFDAFLVNTEDFLSPLMLAGNKTLSSLDFSEYSIRILYAEEQPLTASETIPAVSYGICASSASQARLDDFLTWLSVPENYLLLRYGLEDIDYRRENERFIPDPASEFLRWEQRVLFENSLLEPEITLENVPANFYSELELLENAPKPLFDPDAVHALSELLIDSGHILCVAQNASAAHAFWESTYTKGASASVRTSAEQWLDSQDSIAHEDEILTGLLYEYLSGK